MADFTIKQNDTLPALEATLLNYDNSPYVIQNGSTIRFVMRAQTNKAIKVASTSVSVVDGPNGVVVYNWGDTDTDTPGLFDFEFEVTTPGGKRLTFPNNTYRVCEIVADLVTQ